jgi:fructokinase
METTRNDVPNILGIGELLWDLLPAGPQLGGAPANYTVMAGRLGNHASIISRIGRDALGARALEVLKPFPVNCGLLQFDEDHPTGSVTVELKEGQPSYTIHQPVAWDFCELSDAWLAAAHSADAVCFGSLVQRGDQSRATVQSMVRATRPGCQRIFDVNLRAPFYNAQIVRESLGLATVMKMNDQEVPIVLDLLGIPPTGTLRDGADQLLKHFESLQLVAITCGGDGSLLVSRSEWNHHPGIAIKVADTIGAGDAFTAAMTHYLLRGAPLRTLNEAGNRWGSFVASHSGAMPEISPETLSAIAAQIEAN